MHTTSIRWSSAALLALAALGPLAAWPSAHAATAIVEIAPAGPMPPVIVEKRPPAPGATWHWVPGHWVWHDVRWEWRKGAWVERDVPPPPPPVVETLPPPPTAWVWIQGHWVWGAEGWHWAKGHYVPR